ncbi:transporter, partial [Acidithiobacillus ferrooxidans]
VGETAWQLRNRVRQRFLELFAAIEQIKVLKAETAVRSRMLELISQRFSVGESATFEVNSAQLALQRTQMALAAAKAHAASVRAALAEALGLPVGAIADTRFDFTSIDRLPALQQLSTRTLERVALLHRLDLRRALAQYAAAEDTLKLEIAKQYPNINLGPGYEWEEGDSRWSLSLLSLTLPLLNQNQGPIAVAKARVTEESARFAALQAQVIGQVSQAVVGYRGAVQTLHTAQNLFTTQTKHQRMLDQRFAAGAIGSVAMLGGHLASLVAAQDRLAALYQAQQALGTLENALQRPFTEHLSLKPALHEKSPSGRERARA